MNSTDINFSNISNKYLLLDLSSNLNRIFHFAYKSKFQKTKYFISESKSQLDELKARLLKTDKRFEKTYEQINKMLINLELVNENELPYEFLDDLITYSAITQSQAKHFE